MKQVFRSFSLALMLLGLLGLLGLVGCGLKGPLYMPSGEPTNIPDSQKNTHQKPSMRP
ncbi:lipoprotein [Candidatus Symbiopectobacterium sp.]|uniref:LPS translocon maturation chaperone LptM n=1 Tax=Candidatus Symbiopectobacterium sp. TaxID=2816440 RepID=UPI0025BE048C|nr:lipoprotein [Candidatus Symbiopectobacterium sp.]